MLLTRFQALLSHYHILRVSLGQFSSLFRQKQTLFAQYNTYEHPDVTIYEFFLPLTCEDILRGALDVLFYKDTVINRLKGIGPGTLEQIFGRLTDESEKDYLDRVCDFVDNKFLGYSVSHVNGRFRAAGLLTREDAATLEREGQGYLIDETTAVVRFIIPHETTKKSRMAQMVLESVESTIKEEIEKTEWLFENLFVNAVKQATTNQDEIWLLETGRNHRLFKYVSAEQDES